MWLRGIWLPILGGLIFLAGAVKVFGEAQQEPWALLIGLWPLGIAAGFFIAAIKMWKAGD